MLKGFLVLASLAAGLVSAIPGRAPAPPVELWRQVEVIRTAHGVPADFTGYDVATLDIGGPYGQSPQPASPWHADQAAMFARGEMKRVAFTARDVDAGSVVRYRPGER